MWWFVKYNMQPTVFVMHMFFKGGGGGGANSSKKSLTSKKKKEERGNDQVTDIWNESQVGILMATHDCNKIRSEYLMNEFDIYPSYFTLLMMLLNTEE